MNRIITLGTMFTLLFIGLAQTGAIAPRIGYAVGGGLAAVTFALAIVRYRKRKREE